LEGEVMVTKKRMGGMRLSDFGGQPASVQAEPEQSLEPAIAPTIEATTERNSAKISKRKPPKKEERLVVVNVKVKESQQNWLADTAKLVRQNNEAPVPASDRVYPQHLIQTAIDLLQSAEVNWQDVKSIEELRQALDL
jgi:hypothetical protein